MQSVLIRCLFNLCEILFNPCNSNVRAELKSVSSVQSVVEKEVYCFGVISVQSVLIRCLFNLYKIPFNPCNSNVRAELNPFNPCNLWSKKRFTAYSLPFTVFILVFVFVFVFVFVSCYNDTNICSNICRSCWRSLMMRRSSRRFCSLSDPAIQSLMYPAEEYFCCKCSTKRSQCSSLVFSG